MFSKKKSKEILKFKYLWLIPVLIGMVFYTSCENTEPDKALSKVNEKRHTVVFIGTDIKGGSGGLKKIIKESGKLGYLDMYIFGAIPDGKLISYKELSDEEKNEFDLYSEKMKDIWDGFATYKFFENENGERAFQEIIDTKKFIKSKKYKDYSNADVVPFAAVDQVPIYPGCEDAEDQKVCMVEKITKFVNSNFDTSLSKNLGLEAGKKRIYVQFKVDKTGKIVDVKARGPHETLETEAVRVVNGLPTMKPGEQNGEKVSVKYTLPITLVVE
jgi:hypothetical protein